MASTYTKILDAESYEGIIDGIYVKWAQNPEARLANDEETTGVSAKTLKAISEHFAVLVTTSMQNSTVKILGAPHTFTIDSTTGKSASDDLHIRVSTSGPQRGGSHNIHIYLAGEGDPDDESRFDNLRLNGQIVWSRIGTHRKMDESLSTSNYCENGTWQLWAAN